jgi:hypothetical protein
MSDTPEKKPFPWLETAGAVLMAVSSLGTAWCSFEVSRWGGKASERGGAAAALERKANLLRIEGTQVQTVHVQMFMEYVSAHMTGNAALERFYTDRFPPELKTAFDAWIAQKPFEDPAAPPHPFAPPLYEMRHAGVIKDSLRDSASNGEEARTLSSVANSYLTTTIVLATVLFFIGITSRLPSARVRLGTFCFGGVLFLAAVVRIATLPWML